MFLDKSRDKDKGGKLVLCIRKVVYVQNADMSYKLTPDNKGITETHWTPCDLTFQEAMTLYKELPRFLKLWNPHCNVGNFNDTGGEYTPHHRPPLKRSNAVTGRVGPEEDVIEEITENTTPEVGGGGNIEDIYAPDADAEESSQPAPPVKKRKTVKNSRNKELETPRSPEPPVSDGATGWEECGSLTTL